VEFPAYLDERAALADEPWTILVRTANGVIFDNPFFKRWVIFHAI
jgi:hypothetical protein